MKNICITKSPRVAPLQRNLVFGWVLGLGWGGVFLIILQSCNSWGKCFSRLNTVIASGTNSPPSKRGKAAQRS